MIAYISGKITGDEHYREKFANAETVLTSMGYTVKNPATLPDGLDYETYMQIDEQMIDASDIVVMLPDWRGSNGAKRERQYARKIGKCVDYYAPMVQEWLKGAENEPIS